MSEHNDEDLYGDEEGAPAHRVGNGPAAEPEPSKMQNVAALGKNPKTSRVIIATAAAVAVVGGLAAVGVMSRNHQAPAPTPAAISGASVGAAPTGLSDDPNAALANSAQYKGIVAGTEQERTKQAQAKGLSTQPLAETVDASLKKVGTPAEEAASAAEAQRRAEQAAAVERARAAASQAQQQQAGGVQGTQPGQQDPAYQQMMTNAQSAVAALISPRSRGTGIYSMADPQQAQKGGAGGVQQVALQQGAGQAGAAGRGAAAPTPSSVSSPEQLTLISAGIIESARIDVAINTDIGGDFGATLLTGKYAGAKLIGASSRKGDLAAGSIRMLSLPGQGVSVPVSAVILDAETGEGATATDVDRKLLVKYGIKPIASGFAAVADYLKNSGTTVVVDGQTVTSTQPELTNKRAGQIVVGSAAQQVSNDANALDTTPTARVRRGAIVGVFFTQDVVYTPKK